MINFKCDVFMYQIKSDIKPFLSLFIYACHNHNLNLIFHVQSSQEVAGFIDFTHTDKDGIAHSL